MKKITFFFAVPVMMIGMKANSQMARVQAVHNSPDAALSVIDVYLGDVRIIDNIGYKVATPFLDSPAGIPLTFTVAPGSSTSVADGIYSRTVTFEPNTAYIFTANGIHSTTGYTPAPQFGLTLYEAASETGFVEGSTSILVHHGSTDSGNVTVSETSVPLGMFLYDMPYPLFTNGYFNMPTMDYAIQVDRTSDNGNLGSYYVPLAAMNMAGKAAMILSTGFAHPENNSNGEPFALYMVLPEGGSFIPLQAVMATGEFTRDAIAVYPNPADNILNIEMPAGAANAETSLFDMSGRLVMQSTGMQQLNVSGLSNGFYLLHANIDGRVLTHKIAIKH